VATIQDIVTGAFQKLGLIGAGNSPEAQDSAYALNELNDMMLEMNGKDVFINWETMALTDTFPLEAKHEGGVKAMLALRVANTYGGDGLLSSGLVRQAKDAFIRIWGDYHRSEPLTADNGLTQMPGNWYSGVDNVNV